MKVDDEEEEEGRKERKREREWEREGDFPVDCLIADHILFMVKSAYVYVGEWVREMRTRSGM